MYAHSSSTTSLLVRPPTGPFHIEAYRTEPPPRLQTFSNNFVYAPAFGWAAFLPSIV
jgi:hypothetical protein